MSKLSGVLIRESIFKTLERSPQKSIVPSWTLSEQLATLQATESSLYTHTLSFNNPNEWYAGNKTG